MVKPIPDGYHTVTPYLAVKGAARLLDFLKQAFGARQTELMPGPNGQVMHAEVRIGDSVVMLGEATEEAHRSTAQIYLYVEDCESVYRQALSAGGESMSEPETMFYGDRHAAVRDPAGNTWSIATHVEDVSREEMERRRLAMQRS